MRSILSALVTALVCAPAVCAQPAEASAAPVPPPLVWDATHKTIQPASGQTTALFSFVATNASRETVEIRGVQAPCDCTTVHLLPRPWLVPPLAQTVVAATLEFGGKSGVYTKSLTVDTTGGSETLTMTVEITGVAPARPKSSEPPASPLPRP